MIVSLPVWRESAYQRREAGEDYNRIVKARTLIIEDEGNLIKLLRGYLEREGFEVHEALDGESGIEMARSLRPDVIVLDWMLPRMDGLEVLRELRTFSEVYVIMLTARAEEGDKIVGLSAGADDYLTKPFSPGELVARVRAMLRRPRAPTPGRPEEEQSLRFRDFEIDPARREVKMGGEEVPLTALEFDLLIALASRPGFVFGRRRLLERAWGEDYFGDDHVVDVHIANLRKKLNAFEKEAGNRYIRTVRGVGYKFEER